MPDRVILDSAAIAAIFFKEESSERAERVAENYKLITVDLAIAEVANVAWKRVVFFNESKEIALKALSYSKTRTEKEGVIDIRILHLELNQ